MNFLETKIVRSLEITEEAPQGLVLAEGKIWTIADKSSSIKKLPYNITGKLSSVDEVTHCIKNPACLAWTGSEFLILEKATKTIYKIDPKKGAQLYLDLMNLKSNTVTDIVMPILKARGVSISALSFNQGKLWIAVKAGYSSSILVFDDQTKELVNNFFARGPEPVGIAFEANGEAGWVLDGSNKELRQFDTNGNWRQTVLKIPIKQPLGLAIDNEGNFLTADLATNKIYFIAKRGIA
jgi:DNA-binding beta-propeller fold protein YncE